MKLESSKKFGKASNTISEYQFGIGNTTLVLEYLRDHIYKNPIMALTREYASNARDAHREVGTPDIPIEITLPNSWNPAWECKDFGPGISPERMEQVFTKFGNSSKRDSNEQTGAFGLGAKSGWAYADTFTVTTIHEGTKYHYSAILDGGSGKMVLLSKEETSEPSGTIIAVPVATDDFDSFHSYTMMATSFWDVKPTLKGITPAPEFVSLNIKFSGKGWKLNNKKNARELPHLGDRSLAIVDGIPYHIEKYSIDGLTYDEQDILECSLYLMFEVGDLDLAPSRDNLRYTAKTQSLVKARLREAMRDLESQIKDKISTAQSYYDAAMVYHAVTTSLPRSIHDFISTPVWNSLPVKTSIRISNDIGPHVKMISYKPHSYNETGISACRTNTTTCPLKEDTLVLFNDEEKNVSRKAIALLLEDKNNPYTQIDIISCPTKSKWGTTPSYTFDVFDRFRIQKLSNFNLPKPPKVKSSGGGGRPLVADGNIMAYSLNKSYSSSKIDITCIELENKEGVYIEVDYKTKTFTSEGKHICDWSQISEFQTLIGEKIYGFTETRVKKLASGWRPLKDVLKEKVEERLQNYSLDELLVAHASMKAIPRVGWIAFFNEINLPDLQDQNGLFSKSLKSHIQLIEKKNIISELYRALHWLKYYVEKDIDDNAVKDKYNKILDTYPMLKYIDTYNLEQSVTAVVDYVNLVDSVNFNNATTNNVVALAS